MTIAVNKLYCGDNLEILKRFPSGVVDLCYIDPPFFSRRNHVDFSASTSEVRGFQDTWGGKMEKYLSFMKPRIQEIYRVLKPNGTFYLHCDVSGVFHLKVACDEIFGEEGFLNCIIWKRHSPSKNTDRNFGSIVDYILVYVKGSDYVFNVQYLPIDEKVFNLTEPETGRKFRSQPLVVKGNQAGKVFDFGGRKYTIKEGKALKWTQKTIDKRLKRNPRLIYWTSGGEPRYKTYLDEHKGIKLSCLWTDIKLITSTSSERLNYPTQKPRKLLERIIKVSTNEGDLVLDAFNGSGTTIYCAKKLNRKFIGIDVSPTACRLAASRIGYNVNEINGHPYTIEDLKSIPFFEYKNWVCWKMNATQKMNNKKFKIDAITRSTRIPIIIKQENSITKADLAHLKNFLSMNKTKNSQVGVVITLDRQGSEREIVVDEYKIKHYSIKDLNEGMHNNEGISINTTLA
ncbi:MAG: DNA methyltransferase [Promethearchaeota archaeon]